MTRRHVATGVLGQRRLDRAADLGCARATRVEPAGRRRVDRARRLALQRDPLALAILLWVRQYRTTRQRIYQADTFGGYTSELAGPATRFFILFTVLLTGWAVVLIVGHLVWGQKF